MRNTFNDDKIRIIFRILQNNKQKYLKMPVLIYLCRIIEPY